MDASACHSDGDGDIVVVMAAAAVVVVMVIVSCKAGSERACCHLYHGKLTQARVLSDRGWQGVRVDITVLHEHECLLVAPSFALCCESGLRFSEELAQILTSGPDERCECECGG